MNELFSTKERVALLREVINRKGFFSVCKLAEGLNLSKGFVSKYLDILRTAGIVQKNGGKYMLAGSSLLKALRLFFSISSIDSKLFAKHPFVIKAGIYGSSAKGDNTEESDTDMWILVKKTNDHELASLTSELNNRFVNLKISFFTSDKIERMKKEDTLFYYSLFFGSIVIYGGPDGV